MKQFQKQCCRLSSVWHLGKRLKILHQSSIITKSLRTHPYYGASYHSGLILLLLVLSLTLSIPILLSLHSWHLFTKRQTSGFLWEQIWHCYNSAFEKVIQIHQLTWAYAFFAFLWTQSVCNVMQDGIRASSKILLIRLILYTKCEWLGT